jgi:tetratricopeptide (TPR) repeat protein
MGLSDNLRNIEAEIAAGHPEKALTLCLELQTLYPRALAVQRVLGEAYLALRKPREALGALDRALAGNPEDARACCARAIVQQIHGDAASALKWYRRACDITPDDQVLRGAYRELALSQDQPAYHPTRIGLARLYLRGDLFPHALREWESLLAEEPDSLEVQVGLAETLWKAQRLQPAIERCERILINAPSCVKAIVILAVIEHDAGHDEIAERLVGRTADLDPDCRIGQILCADRLAAGDTALQALLMRQEVSTSASLPEAGALPAGARVRIASEPLPEPSVLRNSPVQSQPVGSTDPLPESAVPGQQQRSGLPANFRNIFAETEYMLWGKESDDLGEMSRASQVSPGSPGSVDQFARSNVFVPQVLRDQGANLDETEARTSINFVNWLQAQGALQQDGVPSVSHAPISRQLPPPSSSGADPFSSQMPPLGQSSSSPVELGPFSPTGSPEGDEARSAEIPNAELQPDVPSTPISPQTDELRRMFAQLGQQPGTRIGADEGFFAGSETDLMGRGRSEPPETFQPRKEVEPKDYPSRLERARARLESGHIEDALTDYRLVLKNAPDLLGDVMSDLNDSLEEAPDHPEVHRLLGDAYIRQGNYLQALEAYNRAVALTQAQNG